MKTTFSTAVENDFSFLVGEYGFSLSEELYSPEFMGNSVITYLSDTMGIMIVLDRSQVSLRIGESDRPSTEWIDLLFIARFYTVNEKLDVYQYPKENPYNIAPIEEQVKRLARVVKQYCDPVLKGDFSKKEEIIALQKRTFYL